VSGTGGAVNSCKAGCINMFGSKSPYRFHFGLLRVLLLLLVLCTSNLHAQDSATGGRIVEGRPPFYSLKHAIHPLTWFENGTEPLFRAAETGWIHKFAARRRAPDKTAGVKFGLDGAGPGSGFGPVVTFYNKNLLGRGIDVKVPLLYTYNGYEVYQLNASVPVVSDNSVKRLTFDVATTYSSRAKDDFFPLGNDSVPGSEARIRTIRREVAIGFSAPISDRWKAGLYESYRNFGITKPYSGRSAQDQFRSSGIPGLLTGGVLLSTVITLDHNKPDPNQMPARDDLEHAEISFNESVDKGNFAYWKYRLHFQHFFPLSSDRRTVIALRGFAETNQRSAGNEVPWFDMPALGSWETLRGFENFQFRDRNAVSIGTEYRYRIWRAMDWGFFLDEGQVASRPSDFGWNRFHAGYGVRLFIFPKPAFPVAIDVAHSIQKWRLYVNFNTTF
jgi:outer membrane protein assembly factor BamA